MGQDASQDHEQIIHEKKNAGEIHIQVCLLLHLSIYWFAFFYVKFFKYYSFKNSQTCEKYISENQGF